MRITTTIALAVALTGAAFTASAQETEYTPMTRSERFRNYLAGTVAPGSLAGVVARAGFEQWRNSPTEWGQGSEGFSDRLGNAYAKHFIRRTLEFGASSALHQDDRYLASGEKGFWRRTKYAVASTFLARRDSGERTFALARFGSAAGTAYVSNIWQPASRSGADHIASSFGFIIATDIGTNVVREFWPDLKRRFHKN